ncbi:MAG: site-specific integrase [Saonia sp.]
MIKNKLLNKEQTHKTLLAIYDEYNVQIEQLLGIDYSYGAYRRHIRTRNHLVTFIKKEYRLEDIFVKEVDLKFIDRFHHYLKTKKIGSQNTITKYVVNFKKIMRIAFANNWVNKDPFYHWKAQWKKVDRDVLTEAELRTMMVKELPMKRLEQVRDMFVFCCFTGLAYVDVQKLSQNHIVLGTDGGTLDQNKSLQDRFPKYRSPTPCCRRNIGTVFGSSYYFAERSATASHQQSKNQCLFEGNYPDLQIEKNLTFHLARHTFATTVTLANGIPIESVSKMLGHQSLRTTQIYAKVIDKKLSEDMNTLRGKFKISKK